MRTVFLGSPPFATPILERLLASPVAPELVVTPPARRRGRGRKQAENAVATCAQAAGVDVWTPETVRDPEVMERLRAFAPDCILVVAYGELLRQEFLDLPRLRILNVHPSLLPRWRGATPIPAAVRAGDRVTGTTIQEVVLALDAGDVVVQKELEVLPGETAGELAARLASLSGEAAVEALEAVADGTATFRPQDPEGVTVCRKLTKADARLDWDAPALELERLVRAMHPWPLAHTTLPAAAGKEPKQLNVLRATVLEREPDVAPGTLLQTKGELVVAAGTGALRLELVQVQGKQALEAGPFLAGARLEPGERLG